MGRELKRVPLDFDWPLNKVWYGYYSSLCTDGNEYAAGGCDNCRKFAAYKNIPLATYGCPDYSKYMGPPEGDGYQLWESTSEGSPVSPVFASLDGLCEWCESNATTFGRMKATKEEWKQMLDDGLVCAKQGNVLFI